MQLGKGIEMISEFDKACSMMKYKLEESVRMLMRNIPREEDSLMNTN